jgi:hypothetical protein
MKKTYIKFLALFITGVVMVSCENEFENSIEDGDFYTAGEADFSNFVTVGNSLTAGYMDNALYLQGQQNSYPNIMAQQMALVGGGQFIQPLVNDNAGGLLAAGVQITPNKLVLASNMGTPTGPVTYTGMAPTTDITNKVTGPLNNYGVPGARVFHLGAPGYGSLAGVALGAANPYYARFSSSETSTVIGDAAAANATFFTLWIGNNDILGYATSGGVGVDNNVTGETNPALQGDGSITNNGTFNQVYNGLVGAMVANGAKGALVNIPDVTSIPFFTTVPFAPLSPLDPNFGPQIPTLNATYASLNQAFAFLGVPERSITFSQTAASAVVVKDESLTDLSMQLTQVLIGGGLPAPTAALFGQQFGQARQATANDLLVLTSSGIIGQPNQTRFAQLVGAGVDQATAGQLSINGVTFPLEDQWVLIPAEQAAISSAQASYNATIEAAANANGLAFVDARAALATVADGGVMFNGGMLTSTFAAGGAFSLDGVHPTGRGYAYTANVIMQAINDTYGSTLPMVDIGNYPSVQPSDAVN